MNASIGCQKLNGVKLQKTTLLGMWEFWTGLNEWKCCKENAMEAQDEDFYKVKMAEYNAKKADMAKVLHDLMNKTCK